MFDLVGIGDPVIDTHVQIEENCAKYQKVDANMHLCFEYGEKIPIIDSFQALGGNAPNVAIGAKRLGLTSAVVSTVGQDTNGKIAKSELKKQGVDTTYISADPKHKSRYSIVLNYRGERTILSYSDAKTYRWPNKFPATNWIYYTGLSKGFEVIQEKLLAHLAIHPTIRLAVNPGSYMLKYAPTELNEAVAKADLLLVNLEEAEKISGTTLAATKSVAALIQKLNTLGAKEVALTDGAKGSWAGTADAVWHLDAYPIKVTSKTGAGDAFSSAYMAARFYGHDLAHALAWGTANSTGVIQQHGPHAGLLDQAAIKKMIGKFPDIKPLFLT